ncbi:MAG: hypothetical protein HC910_12435 [Spirulinaceae cyanobacterium SM2_1_0]|nr:hypothetical protein [Spirulinaceae cyanobacterium SM2_1_0]
MRFSVCDRQRAVLAPSSDRPAPNPALVHPALPIAQKRLSKHFGYSQLDAAQRVGNIRHRLGVL